MRAKPQHVAMMFSLFLGGCLSYQVSERYYEPEGPGRLERSPAKPGPPTQLDIAAPSLRKLTVRATPSSRYALVCVLRELATIAKFLRLAHRHDHRRRRGGPDPSDGLQSFRDAGVPLSRQLPRPKIVRPTAGFHRHHARRQRRHLPQHLVAPQHLAQHYPAITCTAITCVAKSRPTVVILSMDFLSHRLLSTLQSWHFDGEPRRGSPCHSLNRTGRYPASFSWASARPAGWLSPLRCT